MELTKTDIVKFLTKIRVNFENAYKCNTKEENILLVESWYDILSKYPKELCEKALNEALERATQGKAPRVGDIVECIRIMQNACQKDDNELWAELRNVLREVLHCTYRFQNTYIEEDGISQGDKARRRVAEIFDNLDPVLKDYCRDQRGLVELAQYTDEQISYERGRFLRFMPTVRERLKTRREMPDNIKKIMQGMNDETALPFSNENFYKRQLK